MSSDLTIAHWVMSMTQHVDSLENWIDCVQEKLSKAAEQGADILVMPELACEQWMHFAPAGLTKATETAWMAEQAKEAIPALQSVVTTNGIALMAGSYIWEEAGRLTNRAFMLFPDREMTWHDKLVLTPPEKDPAGWNLNTGDKIMTCEWRGWRMAILTCLDIEMPYLSYRLADQDIDLLFVSSMTQKPSGYHRVFDCAKARAIELMAAVSVTGCTGQVPGRNSYTGGAAVFLPCEEALGSDGTQGQSDMLSNSNEDQLLIVKDIPLSAIRSARHGSAEVWPGPWSPDCIVISQ